jgi:hypothetical protein
MANPIVAEPIAPDAAIGIWKLDIDKSTFLLAPAPKTNVMAITLWNGGLKMTTDAVDSAGERLHMEAAYKLDGNDYPITGSHLADTLSTSRLNECTTETVWRKAGNLAMASWQVVSLDGKSMQVIRTGVGPLGHIADEVWIYERQ